MLKENNTIKMNNFIKKYIAIIIFYRNKISIVIYILMNKNLDVVEDIKQNITESQYKIRMDSLMEVYEIEN